MKQTTQQTWGWLKQILLAFTLFSASASIFADEIPATDPYQSFNRIMFDFNERIDQTILKPVATFYNDIVPTPLNKGIHNFFVNINTLPTIADDVLQVNFQQAANDIWRVLINTTIGIGGLFDIADRMNLHPYANDFGLTLAKWGYTNTNYLVLPFLGPSTVRDGIGIPVDYFAFSIYPYISSDKTRYGLFALGVIDTRAQLLKYQNVMDEAALDRYAFVRNAYLQHRAYQIEKNQAGGATKDNYNLPEPGFNPY
jgi:phospholipid-binding lipoprotein MlaA